MHTTSKTKKKVEAHGVENHSPKAQSVLQDVENQ